MRESSFAAIFAVYNVNHFKVKILFKDYILSF